VPRVIVTQGALTGLERCRIFLSEKNPKASVRASQSIATQFELLEITPQIGRPMVDHPEIRELVIPFGNTGYIALYRYVPSEEDVFILAFRHQKEAGY
jgi:plasmid stabilization system protein ParE